VSAQPSAGYTAPPGVTARNPLGNPTALIGKWIIEPPASMCIYKQQIQAEVQKYDEEMRAKNPLKQNQLEDELFSLEHSMGCSYIVRPSDADVLKREGTYVRVRVYHLTLNPGVWFDRWMLAKHLRRATAAERGLAGP
jgi:hypothetical protein